MKKLLVFLLLAITFQGFAQTNYITGINISLPSNPDANIEKWSSSMPPFMISAQTRLENGRVSPIVMESNILVSIRGGGVACGSFTKANAPASNFNATSKVWAGKAALDLLGTPCILKPGSYELCVQFFGEGAAGKTLIGEACKSFTVANVETEAKIYQPPQALTPADGTQFSDSDLKKPMTFRWTPVIPRPQEPTTYRLTVWQLMQGQTGTQAMHVNQPIITKNVDNMTQAVIYITGDFTSPQFIWNVQALNKEGKPIGENEGKSKPFQFSASACDVNLKLELKSIVCLPATHGFNNYKVCVSSTYTSSNYNLTYSGSNGFKAYAPSYSPFYTVSNITPALQIQNSGSTTTVNYCFDVSVPTGQTSIKVGLQGDDKDPGPMVCQPGAELDLRLPNCTNPTCDCGTWSPLTVLDAAQGKRYDCGSTIEWTCKQALNFTANYQCSPNDKTCEAKTTWEVKKGNIVIKSGTGTSQLNDGFSLLENGTYTLTLNASCNDKKCPPCTYTIIVRDCKPCDCGSWSPLTVQNAAGIKSYTCGIKMVIPWSCNQAFNFTDSYQCSPNDRTCQAETKWEVKKGNIIISSGTGTNNLNGTFTPTENGLYTITLNAKCNGKSCTPCTYTISVEDCCQDSKIIIKKKNVVISNNGECLKSGVYTFINNLAPSTPIVNGTYVLTSTPNNVTVSTGNFTSGVPLNLTIPQYVCGSVTGFKLTYTWNRGKCSKTIERTICPPPCCDNITLKKTSKLLTGTDLNFTTEFSVSPSTTFTKVKVQILDINVSGAAKPWANILSLNETTWGSGTTNPAITTPGNAIWFNGSLTASGILTFNGKIINIYGSATTSTVNLIVRFTFYQNNGSCNEVICEKDISYNNVIGPR